ncbi:MAG: hypothetical protein AN484_28860 [Aphanizomenon flos-aquae WA102]|uniref:Uncharacterized protein n=1 Tax=Aphanizomenon flos-aquae WA102 TaxID=1710896 RepID=A0A1B7W3D1_APHFL|nr:MAG: hypothetical protein AN484_28860 [Aphanizomenon flos-aquae WA102]
MRSAWELLHKSANVHHVTILASVSIPIQPAQAEVGRGHPSSLYGDTVYVQYICRFVDQFPSQILHT